MTQNVWCETFWILYFRSIDCFSCEYRMCICEGSPLKIYRMFCNGKRGNGYSPLFSGQCCSMDLVVLVTRLRFDCFNHSIPTIRTRNTRLSNTNIIKNLPMLWACGKLWMLWCGCETAASCCWSKMPSLTYNHNY